MNRNRDRQTGRFGFDGDHSRRCTCGHALAVHAGAAPHSCLNEDSGLEGATGSACACARFALARLDAEGGAAREGDEPMTKHADGCVALDTGGGHCDCGFSAAREAEAVPAGAAFPSPAVALERVIQAARECVGSARPAARKRLASALSRYDAAVYCAAPKGANE